VFTEFPVDLTTGRTRIGQDILENEIPFPLHHKGPFELRLQAMWQEAAVVTLPHLIRLTELSFSQENL
jgi:hypothetical protein